MKKQDKSQIKFFGKYLINFIYARASKQVENLVINSNNKQLHKVIKKTILKDHFDGFLGPLSGVYTGLRWLQKTDSKKEWLMTFPVDSPFFPRNLVRTLISNNKGEMIITARSNERTHPVFSLWNINIVEKLEESLINQDLKIDNFTKKFKTKVVNFPIKDYDPFYNINREQDLIEAKEIYNLFKQEG